MDGVEQWTKFLEALNSLKTPVIILFVLGLSAWLGTKWWTNRCANERSRKRDSAIDKLVEAVQKQLNSFQVELASKAFFDHTLNEIKDTLEEVKNGFDGKINKPNSIRIIQSTFDAVQHRLASVIERSLYHNGYVGAEDYIADKVRTEMSEVLIDARSKLERFPLVVSTEHFFLLHDGGAERFKLCDLMWVKVEPLFRAPGDLQSRIERAKLLTRNIVSDYVVTRLQEVPKADLNVTDEMHKQAFERNKRLHDTGKVSEKA